MVSPFQPQQMSQQHQPTTNDFGSLVRRIVHTNSGQHPVLEVFASPAAPGSEKSWTRYRGLAESAYQQGNYSQAEAMWLGALSLNLDEQDSRLAYTLEKLGILYSSTQRYEQAEMFCRRAVETSFKSRGEHHTKTAACLNTLAGIYFSQNRFAEAEDLCEKMLAIYENAFGPDACDVGMAASNLAMIYHSQYKFVEAKKMYERALQIRTKALGPEHACVVTLKRNFEKLLKHMMISHRYNCQFEELMTA
jgi:tetratricopeptide (TPR) repeat protein